MPPITVSNREEDSMNNEPSLSGKQIIGIIYPPPDIRTIVDKTAAFVARNGIDFENKIREKEAGNPRFNFLSQTDPYNAYYQHKVREHQEGKAVEPSIQKPQLPDAIKQHVQQLEFIPRDPPPDFEFSADPATINAFDLDLIKLTALFVARNGRQFLTQLMNREIRNYQFDFLKPQHSNFSYFTKLVEQYTKVIIPPKSLVNDLRLEVENPKKFLDQVKYRVEWERHQRRIKEREEAEAEKERLAYAQIDWHDFVVVQTVDFQPNEISNLPPLCTPKDVGTRILAQARQEAAKAAAQTVEMDMESDSDEEPEKNEMDQEGAASGTQSEMPPENTQQQQKKAAYEVTQPMPAPPQAQNVVIRKDYDPKKARAADISSKKAVDKWIISPLTGERLPADKLAEHMRYNTVDAQYFVQREREQLERQDEEPVFAPGVDIGRNIEKFAERRTDIFGVGAQGAEQTVIGKKMGEEEIKGPDQKIIWDGHQSSIDATTKAAQQSITIDQQIAEIHKAQGFLPNPDKEKIGPASTTGGGGGPSSSGGPPAAPPAAPPSMPPAMAPRPPQPPMHMLVSQHAAPPVLHVPMQMVGIRPVPVMQQQPRFVPPPMGMGMGMPMGGMQMGHPMPPQQQQQQQHDYGGPPAKRARTEEDLEPEEVWLKKHQGTINVRVAVPAGGDRPEWKLDGGIQNIPLDITESIATLKNKIQDTTGVPASKQKIVFDGLFVKDSQSLAYYNMSNGSIVHLQLKERGGRKK